MALCTLLDLCVFQTELFSLEAAPEVVFRDGWELDPPLTEGELLVQLEVHLVEADLPRRLLGHGLADLLVQRCRPPADAAPRGVEPCCVAQKLVLS